MVSATLWRAIAGAAKMRRAMPHPGSQHPLRRSAPTDIRRDRPAAANGSGDRAMIVPRLSGRTGQTATVMPGSRSSCAEAARVVARRREQQLQVRAGQPLAAAAEHHARW